MSKSSRNHVVVDSRLGRSTGVTRNWRRLLALVTALSMILGVGAVSMTPAAAETGVDWTEQTASAANNWMSVAYGNGVFVAVSSDGTDQVMTSFDGVTWTARSAAMVRPWTSVTFGNGLFVAVSIEGTNGQGVNGFGTDQVMTSPDGVTWTARLAADWNSWASVTFGNGMFVAVGGSADAVTPVMTSPDGVNWTARSAPMNPWSSVTYGNGVFVAIATGGTDQVMTSYYGDVWTPQSASGAYGWFSVTFGNGTFVAVSFDGNVMTSPDGVTWTDRTAAPADIWLRVTYGNGLFVAVAENSSMTSSDGITWSRPSTPSGYWWSVTSGRGIFVAVSREEAKVMTSGTLAPPTIPSAPTALVATPGDGSASIAYSVDSGGAPISKVQYRVGSGAWTDAVGTSSPITVSGLTNLASSRIKLRAVNSVGTGAASAVVTVMPRPAGPSIVSATPSGSTGFVVTFDLNPLPGTTVAYQSVTASVRGTNTVSGTCRTYAKRTTCYIGGLTRGTDYDLRATAYLPVLGKTWHIATLEGSTLQARTNG